MVLAHIIYNIYVNLKTVCENWKVLTILKTGNIIDKKYKTHKDI